MTNITIDICGAHAKRVAQDGILTTGMVGATVTFQFDEQWSGLKKTAVFRGGGVTRDVLDIGNVVTIPSEVLRSQGTLSVGVEGYNADGTIVIPTVWESNTYIHQGANASGDPSTNPELPVWAQIRAQIRAQIGDLDKLNTTAKESLVAAINEALAKGGGSVDPAEVERLVNEHLATNPPAAGKDGKSAYEIAFEEGFDGSEAEWLESLQGTPGKDGADGQDGTNGKSAYKYAQDGGYTGTEEEFAAKLAAEIPFVDDGYGQWQPIGKVETTEAVSVVAIRSDTVLNEMIAYVYVPPIPEDTGGTAYVRPILKNAGEINAYVTLTKPATQRQLEIWHVRPYYGLRQNWKNTDSAIPNMFGLSADTLNRIAEDYDNGGGLIGFCINWNLGNVFPAGVIMKVWGR